MSSIVNKSGVRFAPKAKQRRSITGTPIASRRPSVTPTPDISRKSIDAGFENSQERDEEDNNDSNDENSDDNEGLDSKSGTIEALKPQETKQRRLSTLSNISKRDIFKKVSVQSGYTHDSPSSSNPERKTHVISIPVPPTTLKRRRSTVSQSRRGSALKKNSVSGAPGEPSNTASLSATSSVPPPPTAVVPEVSETLEKETTNDKSTEKESEQESEKEHTQGAKPSEKLIRKPTFLPAIEPIKDKGKEDEPLSPTTSSTQDPFTSSLPIPSTLPSSLPSSAPESTAPKSPKAKVIVDPSRPIRAPKAPELNTTISTESEGASKEQSPLPIGIPIKRPYTAPIMSKAEGKGPEDNAASSPAPTLRRDGSDDIGQMKEGLTYDKSTNQLRKIMYDPREKREDLEILNSFKAKRLDQLSKNFNSLSPELSQNITIDEESFTINDLCKPTLPIGKVSANFQQAEEARKSKIKLRKERRDLRIQARERKISLESVTEAYNIKKETPPEGQEAEEENKPQAASSSNAGIQLKVGTDGKIIVDEESRVLDRHANFDMDDRERYNQNPFENVVNSATYGKQRYTDKWNEDEVVKFYKALGQWGTDFGLIAQMFPYRTRRQVKAKFILEEKKRPRIVDLALNNKLNSNFNFNDYCSNANKTFGTLNDFNTKLEQLKKDHEENLKELSVAREKAKEEDALRQKKRELEVKSGIQSRPLTRQERLVELRKHETVLGSIDDIKKQREEEENAAAAAAAAAS